MKVKSLMQRYWDKIGAEPKANWHIAHIDDDEAFFESGKKDIRKIFDDKLDTLSAGSLVLDIGCGRGRLSRALAELRSDVRIFGVDVAPSMIRSAILSNAHIKNASFCVCDGESLNIFPDEIFDCAYSYIVFQHLPRHIVGQYISEAARVLKPGGKLIFQIQHRDEPMHVDPAWNDFRKIRYYTSDQAASLVQPPLVVKSIRGKGHDLFVECEKE
ncbi:hypothetical protein CN934_26845 [Ensifer sp. MMN_5]|nr:hypothetical protein CN934_26845 [Ensifer sp. MMN_5]